MNAPFASSREAPDGLIQVVRDAVRLPAGSRIVAAMSGGVDSTVTAALLAKAGYDVVGVTLQLYDHGAAVQKKGACCAGQDIHDARTAAESLGIAHYVLDYESRFKAQVIEEFADSYLRGETPVPCIRCNQTVKFRDLLDVARDLGAEAMATGHYVRRAVGPAGPELYRAADPAKDQSYFLFATTAEQLDYLRFPLGGLEKPVVRAAAAELNLAAADKPDSQDICFVPAGSYADAVGRVRPDALEPGEIVDDAGAVVGLHQGIARYTVGQAKRLGPAGGGRVVTRIEPVTRRIVVGARGDGGRRLRLRETNWLAGEFLGRCTVKLRAGETPRPATVVDGGEVLLDMATLAAPGQACVAYDGSRVLGGGFIAGPATD